MFKWFSISIFSTVFFLIPCLTNAGHFFVTENGSGLRNGLNVSDSWSISDFNSQSNWSTFFSKEKISPGDTVFFIGNFKKRIEPKGSGDPGNPIILDGWRDGSCDPVKQTCNNSAVVTTPSGSGMYLRGNKNLIIQDLRFINCAGSGINSYSSQPEDTLKNIIFRRNTFDGNSNGIFLTSTQGGNSGGQYITFEDSVVVDTAVGNSSSSKASIRMANIEDLIIRRNHVYQRPNVSLVSNGQDGLMIWQCNRVLIENNRVHRVSEDGIDFKNDNPRYSHGNVIIRYNIIYDTHQSGITLQHPIGSNAYVYGNYIYGHGDNRIRWEAILVYRGFKDVAIWANILTDADRSGINFSYQTKNGNTRAADNGIIYNNTIVNNNRNSGWSHGGISLRSRVDGNYSIKNNIFVDNSTLNSAYSRGQIVTLGNIGSYTEEDLNIFWMFPSKESRIYYNASGSGPDNYFDISKLDVAQKYNNFTGNGIRSRVTDPMFINLGKRDLRLKEGSPAIDSGKIMSKPGWWDVPKIQGVNYENEVSLNMAIHPDTDWETTIPKVIMTRQDNHGINWDIGAYVFAKSKIQNGNNLTPPVNFTIQSN